MNPYNTFCEPAKTIATFFYWHQALKKPSRTSLLYSTQQVFYQRRFGNLLKSFRAKDRFPSGWPFKIQYKAALNLLLSVFCSLTRGSGIKYC